MAQPVLGVGLGTELRVEVEGAVVGGRDGGQRGPGGRSLGPPLNGHRFAGDAGCGVDPLEPAGEGNRAAVEDAGRGGGKGEDRRGRGDGCRWRPGTAAAAETANITEVANTVLATRTPMSGERRARGNQRTSHMSGSTRSG